MNKSTRNPISLKTRLAFRFLRAMKRIKNSRRPPSAAVESKRRRAIRAAAYASMASVAGPNKAWSRALLRKVKSWRGQRKAPARNRRIESGLEPEKDLRELIPGGEAMDVERLLNETGHYMKCLRAQVEVMRKIADYSSKKY